MRERARGRLYSVPARDPLSRGNFPSAIYIARAACSSSGYNCAARVAMALSMCSAVERARVKIEARAALAL